MEMFRNLPIRAKLVLILFATTVLTLLVFTSIFVYNDIQNFKKNMVDNLNTLAGTTGANSRAALVFQDTTTAERILTILNEKPQILFAAIFDAEDKLFVKYSKQPDQSMPKPFLKDHGNYIGPKHIELSRPIMLDGEEVGKIFLYAHLKELEDQLNNFWAFVGLVLLGCLGISFFLSISFQSVISSPILNLADTALQVSKEADYSVRVQHESKDEIGTLYSGFNEMLSQIQKRDYELAQYRANLEDLVNERTQELQAAQEELVRKERLAMLGELSAKVSHEIRNPLGTIRNVIFSLGQTLKEKNQSVQRMLDMAERNIIRCDDIIEELLDYARPHEKNPETVTLDSWLEELMEEQAIHPEIEIKKNLSSGVKVQMEPERFRRAVINILQNASQAIMEKFYNKSKIGKTKEEFCLTIETRKTSERVEIFIQDTGTGISSDKFNKIFDPLFSTKSFGVGLGLAIVKEIMQQHEGGIEIGSQHGVGTWVTLWLPPTAIKQPTMS